MAGIGRRKKKKRKPAPTEARWAGAAKKALSLALLLFVAACCAALAVKHLRHDRPADDTTAGAPLRDGLIVYYLHNNTHCEDCTNLEQGARKAVESGFSDKLKAGTVQWRVVNYQRPGNEHYATDYNVVAPSVVLAKMADGKQTDWKGLSEAWQYRNDRQKLVAMIQADIRNALEAP